MSEYQYVAFRAIDRPVSTKNMAYMQDQSSRAEITPWAFSNEYQYGDFRGNAKEMLRRGYDIHLHYANFGIRKLMIRLPAGLPDPSACKPYLSKKGFQFVKDKNGMGGTLELEPYYDGDSLDQLWDLAELLEQLVPLRAEILEGDLRPFYLAKLALLRDDNHDPETTKEPPVPAGLSSLSEAQKTLADFYGLSDDLIAAAARQSPPLPERNDDPSATTRWLKSQSAAAKDEWLLRLLTDEEANVRGELLTQLRREKNSPSWPVIEAGRTIAELDLEAENIATLAEEKATQKAAQQRAKRLKKMESDPASTLREIDKLVAQQSTRAYSEAAAMLAELRKALDGGEHADMADEQAKKLRADYPTKTRLASELRRHGFLPKSKSSSSK